MTTTRKCMSWLCVLLFWLPSCSRATFLSERRRERKEKPGEEKTIIKYKSNRIHCQCACTRVCIVCRLCVLNIYKSYAQHRMRYTYKQTGPNSTETHFQFAFSTNNFWIKCKILESIGIQQVEVEWKIDCDRCIYDPNRPATSSNEQSNSFIGSIWSWSSLIENCYCCFYFLLHFIVLLILFEWLECEHTLTQTLTRERNEST